MSSYEDNQQRTGQNQQQQIQRENEISDNQHQVETQINQTQKITKSSPSMNKQSPPKNQQTIKQLQKLQKIQIQTPIKRTSSRTSLKSPSKGTFSLNKFNSKQSIAVSGLQQSKMKSTIKSSHRSKKANKAFYQQTFYITGMKENYLLLLSDHNQVLQFPIGMFTAQNSQQGSSSKGNSNNLQAQLLSDIKMGQPIKIKLQFDYYRQQKDQQLFRSLQKSIHQEYRVKQQQQIPRSRNKQIILNQLKKQN